MEGLITLAEEQFNRLGADELRRRSGLAEPIDEARSKYRFFHWWKGDRALSALSGGRVNPPPSEVPLERSVYPYGDYSPLALPRIP